MAAPNSVQATDASAEKMDCHAQTSALALIKKMNPARSMFFVRLMMMMMMMMMKVVRIEWR